MKIYSIQRLVLLALALLVAALGLNCEACQEAPSADESAPETAPAAQDEPLHSQPWPAQPQRIVSMAPNITELVFALELGDRLVAVTRYCDWPPEAEELPTVGGVIDPDYEAILAAEPDVVLGVRHDAEGDLIDKIEGGELDYGFVAVDDLDSILAAIDTLGQWFDVEDRANQLRQGIESDLDDAAQAIQENLDGTSPSVLIVVDRQPVVAAGPGSFGDDLLNRGGLKNSLDDPNLGPYPVLDMEQILEIDPAWIIDLSDQPSAAAQSRRYWAQFDGLSAVAADQIVHIDDPLMLRPGPRTPQALHRLGQAFEEL